MKRLMDFLFSLISIIILLPLFFIISALIKASSRGPVFFRQKRVGQYGKIFTLLKFRTMVTGAEKDGLLTIGNKDTRVTSNGYYLRKYKLDELPQLFNVLSGKMSLVGPRPEVPRYVSLYNDDQRKVLNFKPGITDMASIKFRNENELLNDKADPDAYYINHIMPSKIEINLATSHMSQSAIGSLKIILLTIMAIFKN